MAGEQGFEPQYIAPEAIVLPLDDSPILHGDFIIITAKIGINA